MQLEIPLYYCAKIAVCKSKDVFTPPTDHRFGTYEAPVKRKRDIPKSLSYSLLFIWVGVVIVMMYLIIINVTYRKKAME